MKISALWQTVLLKWKSSHRIEKIFGKHVKELISNIFFFLSGKLRNKKTTNLESGQISRTRKKEDGWKFLIDCFTKQDVQTINNHMKKCLNMSLLGNCKLEQ